MTDSDEAKFPLRFDRSQWIVCILQTCPRPAFNYFAVVPVGSNEIALIRYRESKTKNRQRISNRDTHSTKVRPISTLSRGSSNSNGTPGAGSRADGGGRSGLSDSLGGSLDLACLDFDGSGLVLNGDDLGVGQSRVLERVQIEKIALRNEFSMFQNLRSMNATHGLLREDRPLRDSLH